MEEKLYANSAPNERRQYLRDNADKVEKFAYMKQFKAEEIDDFKTELSEVLIKVNAIDEERAEMKAEFKLRMQPLEKQLRLLLSWIRDKAQSVNEECYIMFDYARGMADFYNEDGDNVYTRPILPAERQKTIFTEKTGTNN